MTSAREEGKEDVHIRTQGNGGERKQMAWNRKNREKKGRQMNGRKQKGSEVKEVTHTRRK